MSPWWSPAWKPPPIITPWANWARRGCKVSLSPGRWRPRRSSNGSRSRLGQPVFLHVNKQGGIVDQPQLAHGADFLRADGLLAAVQVRGDLAHRHATGQQANHLQF